MKEKGIMLAFVFVFAVIFCGAVSATETYDIGTHVTNNASKDLNITNSTNSNNVLVITTAGSAKYKGKTTENSSQGIVDTTRTVTQGKGNLITLNEPNGALEFTFVKKISSKELLLKKYTAIPAGSSFILSKGSTIILYDSMTETQFNRAKKLLGNNAFELISIAFAWKNGAPKDLLQVAGFSGGVSEGLISSYAMAHSFVKNNPLTESDQSYHVIVSPGGGDDDVPMFLMDDTPLKWATVGSTKYYNFYGMSNGNPNDNVYMWWDSGNSKGNLVFWILNPQNRIKFGTVVTGAFSEIKFNNWLLGKLSTDASSLTRIEKLATINNANFDYLWAKGIDRNYIKKLTGDVPSWNSYTNILPVNNYNTMFNSGKNAVDKANGVFVKEGLGKLNANDLVITSAGYSQVNGLSNGALDGIISVAGTKLQNILSLKRGLQTPLWFVFVKKPTSADGPLYAVFVDALGNIVPVTYNGMAYGMFDISAANLAGINGTEGYAMSEAVYNAYTYDKPSYAQQDFYIVSLANMWATGTPYDFLRASCDGGCPGSGLSMGYVIVDYIRTHLPLGPNDYYIYVGIPAHCKEQAIMEGLGISAAKGTYFTPGVQSSTSDANSVGIAIRWNRVTNTGTAILIDYNKQIISAIQPQNSNWYRTMYWGIWYLQHGFSGGDLYSQVLSAYSTGKETSIDKNGINALLASTDADPVEFIMDYVAPVTPPTPEPQPQPGNQGTGIISEISDGIAQISTSITQATTELAQQVAVPSKIAPELPSGNDNPVKSTETSGSSTTSIIIAVLLVIMLVLVYFKRDSLISAIRGSEKLGK